jgi:Sec7-like guanine-nucleotide exchange factor
VAKFLWQEYSGLNRQKVGEYLGARENEAVLAEYVHHMDFTNRSLDQALRYPFSPSFS